MSNRASLLPVHKRRDFRAVDEDSTTCVSCGKKILVHLNFHFVRTSGYTCIKCEAEETLKRIQPKRRR